MTRTLAVVYAAKSTEDRHASIPDQLAATRAAALADGRDVVAEFADEAKSAYHGNRGPQLQAAKAMVAELAREHGAAELWVLHSDRLARGGGAAPGDAMHLAEVWFEMRRAGVQLRSVEDDRSLQDLVLVAVMGERNYEDSRRKSLAVKAGTRRRVAERRRWHGRPPYGYRLADGRLVPDPAEAAVVRRIFAEFTAGISQRRVARNLIEDGVPARRGGWHQGTISAILRQPAYLGLVHLNGESFPADHEAIVDADAWEHARLLRDQGTRTLGGNRGRRAEGFLLHGLLTCGYCGGRMLPRSDSGRYECYERRRLGTEHCAQTPVSRELLDQTALEFALNVGVDLDETERRIREHTMAWVAEARELTRQAEREEQLANGRLDRVRRDYQDGHLVADDWAEQRDQLIGELEAATAEVGRLRQREQQIAQATDLLDVRDGLVQMLADVRAAVAGQAANAPSVAAVRATLLRLVTGFTLRPDGDGYALQAHIRPDVFKTGTVDTNGVVALNLERMPLTPPNNDAITFVT